MGCLESKDVLLSFERKEVELKECVSIYICDFMIMWKTVCTTHILALPPMTASQDVNQEAKTGSEKCKHTDP